MYRKFLMGTLMTMGIGLTGISGATAMPVIGSALANATAGTSPVEQVWYHGHRGYYGRGYHRHGYHRGCILGVVC
jgi:hypothetical protein